MVFDFFSTVLSHLERALTRYIISQQCHAEISHGDPVRETKTLKGWGTTFGSPKCLAAGLTALGGPPPKRPAAYCRIRSRLLA